MRGWSAASFGRNFPPRHAIVIRCFRPAFVLPCATAKAMIKLRGSRPRSRASPDMKLCGFNAGLNHQLFVIAGPCVVESREMAMDTAGPAWGKRAAAGTRLIYQEHEAQTHRDAANCSLA